MCDVLHVFRVKHGHRDRLEFAARQELGHDVLVLVAGKHPQFHARRLGDTREDRRAAEYVGAPVFAEQEHLRRAARLLHEGLQRRSVLRRDRRPVVVLLEPRLVALDRRDILLIRHALLVALWRDDGFLLLDHGRLLSEG